MPKELEDANEIASTVEKYLKGNISTLPMSENKEKLTQSSMYQLVPNEQWKRLALHNTKWLLEHYRALMNLYGRELWPEERLDPRSLMEIIQSLMYENAQPWRSEEYIQCLRTSAAKTTALLSYINQSLELYRQYCANAKSEQLRRQYRILKKMYLDNEEPLGKKERDVLLKEISQEESVSLQTVKYDVSDVVQNLSDFLFGVTDVG